MANIRHYLLSSNVRAKPGLLWLDMLSAQFVTQKYGYCCTFVSGSLPWLPRQAAAIMADNNILERRTVFKPQVIIRPEGGMTPHQTP
jgi:hypothetical protein